MSFADTKSFRVLLVEDSVDDAELVLMQLSDAGYAADYERVETAEQMKDALGRRTWDLVLSEFSLPSFSAELALTTLRSTDLDIPFIVVTGTIGEEKAVSLMKAGAHDFVLKSHMRRLVPAIERELREASNRRARREVEQERAHLVSELREAVRVRDEFLSIASHELNTPLTPLKLQAQALKRLLERKPLEGPVEAMIGKMVELIEREIRRIAHLVNDLLDASRIRTGRLGIQPREADLAQLIREAAESLRAQATAVGTKIELDLPETLRGYFDPVRIEEVLFNLLTNGIKYGSGRPVHVRASEFAGSARIVVEDFGLGIAKEDQGRIFDRFERAASGTHFSGLGLGLYISRQIMTAHGGLVCVRSTPGKGSTFVVEFPLNPPATQAA